MIVRIDNAATEFKKAPFFPCKAVELLFLEVSKYCKLSPGRDVQDAYDVAFLDRLSQ